MIKTAIGTVTIEIRCQGVNFSTPKDMEEFARVLSRKYLSVDMGQFECIPKMNTFKLKSDKTTVRK